MGRPVEQLENRVQISQMKPHHRSMARDIVAMGEIRNKDLARIYNMLPPQISIIVNSPVFQAELARLEDEVEESVCHVRAGIRLLVPRAEQVLKEELFKDEEEDEFGMSVKMSLPERKLRLGVALDVLDRSEGKGKNGDGATHLHLHNELHLTKQMTTEELKTDIFDLITKD